MSYEIRHEGPSISTIWWSERLVGTMVAGLGDSWAEGRSDGTPSCVRRRQAAQTDPAGAVPWTTSSTTSYPCSSSSPCGR